MLGVHACSDLADISFDPWNGSEFTPAGAMAPTVSKSKRQSILHLRQLSVAACFCQDPFTE